MVDAETADIEADATVDVDVPADPDADSDDEDTAPPAVDAETLSDRGVPKDHPAPAADSSSIVDSVDQDDDHESGVADQPEPGVDECDSGAAQSDPVEPRPPDPRDGPGGHSDEPGVTNTGEIDLVIFDGDGVPITDDPDDPDTVAALDRVSRTRINLSDTTTEG
ncbi:hypothetical protein ABLE94_10030 [Gordonia sp. VNK1]|uniref:hypothetical protein n=1 Tax=Gordonia oleivorans TaxID=3156618 RepID=UPI0032B4E922